MLSSSANLAWHQSGRAFDGLHAKYKMKKGYVDLFGTQTASGFGTTTDPFLSGDSYFWGLYSGFGGYIKEGLDLDLYLLGLSTASTENFAGTDAATGAAFTYQRDGATLMTAGTRAKEKLGIFDYRARSRPPVRANGEHLERRGRHPSSRGGHPRLPGGG